jgi:5'-nucleotidase
MRALITNDDGVQSAGIRTLTQVAVAMGLDVTVAAPATERSGSSAALSALREGRRLLVEEFRMQGVDGVRVLAVEASPAMIAFTGTRGAFGEPPDIVLSGINHGPNTGQAVLHSGTVGAALTAVSQGVPAMAISMATARTPDRWDTATQVAEHAVGWFLGNIDNIPARPYVLNINVPDVPPDALRGIRPATLASFGAVQAHVGERGSGYVTMTLQEVPDEPAPGTDVALLREGWATATAVSAPVEDADVDLSTIESAVIEAAGA